MKELTQLGGMPFLLLLLYFSVYDFHLVLLLNNKNNNPDITLTDIFSFFLSFFFFPFVSRDFIVDVEAFWSDSYRVLFISVAGVG